MIVQTNVKFINTQIIQEYEGISTDDINNLLPKLNVTNVGSSIFMVDTGDLYSLNTLSDGTTLKWYRM